MCVVSLLNTFQNIFDRCYVKLLPKCYLLKKKLENINTLLLNISISLKINEYLPLFSARHLEMRSFLCCVQGSFIVCLCSGLFIFSLRYSSRTGVPCLHPVDRRRHE